MASPISPISRLPFGSNVGAAVEKYAEFGTADFTVKDYVNRALAGAVSDRSSAIAALKEKDTTSAVAQQELDGFATTVLEEESAKDASGPSPTTSAVSRMPSTLDHPMTSEQLASSLVTNLQSISSEISANIDKVGSRKTCFSSNGLSLTRSPRCTVVRPDKIAFRFDDPLIPIVSTY